jgi:hypothetical protein
MFITEQDDSGNILGIYRAAYGLRRAYKIAVPESRLLTKAWCTAIVDSSLALRLQEPELRATEPREARSGEKRLHVCCVGL